MFDIDYRQTVQKGWVLVSGTLISFTYHLRIPPLFDHLIMSKKTDQLIEEKIAENKAYRKMLYKACPVILILQVTT